MQRHSVKCPSHALFTSRSPHRLGPAVWILGRSRHDAQPGISLPNTAMADYQRRLFIKHDTSLCASKASSTSRKSTISIFIITYRSSQLLHLSSSTLAPPCLTATPLPSSQTRRTRLASTRISAPGSGFRSIDDWPSRSCGGADLAPSYQELLIPSFKWSDQGILIDMACSLRSLPRAKVFGDAFLHGVVWSLGYAGACVG